jgi:hypothetical protein
VTCNLLKLLFSINQFPFSTDTHAKTLPPKHNSLSFSPRAFQAFDLRHVTHLFSNITSKLSVKAFFSSLEYFEYSCFFLLLSAAMLTVSNRYNSGMEMGGKFPRKKLQGEEGEFFIPNLNFSCFQLSSLCLMINEIICDNFYFVPLVANVYFLLLLLFYILL